MAACQTHNRVTRGARHGHELADILRRYLPDYLKTHNLSLWQRKVLYDIQLCRTAALGGHLEVCSHCAYRQPAHNSCHNRHCPKCRGLARRRWVRQRLTELLPIPYYHVVFTLPHRLNTLALYNKKLIYSLFYRAAAYTLLRFGRDPKWLGAQLGFIGVLHTWGKGLCYHVHWHFIVAGGGLSDDGSWVALPYDKGFLFPGNAMAKVVRARFIKLLRKAYKQEKLRLNDVDESLKHPVMFERFLNEVATEKWVNHVKRPFGGPEQVVKYIGHYTHRVALSNQRILSINNGRIRLRVKNYKLGGRAETIELSAEEFIRRFLLHILPKRFRKIRYGGFLSSPVRHRKLALARQALKVPTETSEESAADIGETDSGEICPRCGIGIMNAVEMWQLPDFVDTS